MAGFEWTVGVYKNYTIHRKHDEFGEYFTVTDVSGEVLVKDAEKFEEATDAIDKLVE